jgi:putative glutathione S-transferase
MVAPLHKQGTDDGWHGMITEGGEFPPEKDRYHLYIGAYDVSLSISI